MSAATKRRSHSPPADEYYNHFVLGLPAHSSKSHQSLAATQVRHTPSQQFAQRFSPGHHDNRAQSPPFATGETQSRVPLPVVNGNARGPSPPDSHVHPEARLVMEGGGFAQVREESDRRLGREPTSTYDRLEIRPGSKSPCFSPVPSASGSRGSSPRPSCYDTLAPIDSVTSRQGHNSLTRNEDSKSSSSSPEPHPLSENSVQRRTVQYKKKVELLGHEHMYEAVGITKAKAERKGRNLPRSDSDVEVRAKQDDAILPRSNSDVDSPMRMLSPTDEVRALEARSNSPWSSRKSTITQSRRKHLPLQSVEVEDLDKRRGSPPSEQGEEVPVPSTEEQSIPPLPQKRSRGSGEFGSPKSPRKTANALRKDRLPSGQSTNSDLLSSVESMDTEHIKRESTLSVESTSSADAIDGEQTSSLCADGKTASPLRTPSPSERDTKEMVTISRITGVRVEEVRSTTEGNSVGGVGAIPELPPKRPPKQVSSKGLTTSESSTPSVPRPHPRGSPTPSKHSTIHGPSRPASGANTPPSLPPRPASLHHAKSKAPPPSQDMVYAVMDFKPTPVSNDNYTFVPTVPLVTKSSRKMKSPETSTIYTSINHELTSQFKEFKAGVEAERKEQREVQQRNKT